MKLSERIEAVMEYEDAAFDLDTVAPAVSDSLLVERIAEATHPNGRRSFVIADTKIGWLSRSEAEDRFRERLQFSDGRSLGDWQAAIGKIRRELSTVDKETSQRGLRALKRRGTPIDRSQYSLVIDAKRPALKAALELRCSLNKKFDDAWRRSFQDGRIFYSLGDSLAANLIRPGEKVTKRELRTCMLVFSNDPSLSAILKKPLKKRRKGNKEHIDEPYVLIMAGLIKAGKAGSPNQAAQDAIDILGKPNDGASLESSTRRLRDRYSEWEQEGRFDLLTSRGS